MINLEQMLSDVFRKAALPVIERLGATGALWFLAQGLDPELVDRTTGALVAAGGLLIDVLVRAAFKKWKRRNG